MKKILGLIFLTSSCVFAGTHLQVGDAVTNLTVPCSIGYIPYNNSGSWGCGPYWNGSGLSIGNTSPPTNGINSSGDIDTATQLILLNGSSVFGGLAQASTGSNQQTGVSILGNLSSEIARFEYNTRKGLEMVSAHPILFYTGDNSHFILFQATNSATTDQKYLLPDSTAPAGSLLSIGSKSSLGTNFVTMQWNGPHIEISSTTPSVSSCGATPSPSIVGNDMAGQVTVGGGVVTSCLVTFAAPWTNAPACSVTGSTFITGQSAITSTTTLTISGTATFNGDTIMYQCLGYR